MNSVLPHIKNRDAFIKRIKYSMKDNLCKTIDFDCYVNDFMATSDGECVLSGEGYEIIHQKYEDEINQFFKDMEEQYLADKEDENHELDFSLDVEIPLRKELKEDE